jgi:hypothetical protein
MPFKPFDSMQHAQGFWLPSEKVRKPSLMNMTRPAAAMTS